MRRAVHVLVSLFVLTTSVAYAQGARAEAKGLAAEVNISDDLPERVIGDPVRLRAALENLIDNAVKFTERGQVALAVTVAHAARGRHKLSFTVTDSGIGLSKAEIARRMDRHPSTIGRELRRNAARLDGAYRASKAQERTNGRRSRTRHWTKRTSVASQIKLSKCPPTRSSSSSPTTNERWKRHARFTA